MVPAQTPPGHHTDRVNLGRVDTVISVQVYAAERVILA